MISLAVVKVAAMVHEQIFSALVVYSGAGRGVLGSSFTGELYLLDYI